MKDTRFVALTLVVLMMALFIPSSSALKAKTTPTPKSTLPVSVTVSPTVSVTPSRTPTTVPNITSTPTRTPQANSVPYPDAPLCVSHDPTKWHSLWDSTRGCHFDHEHGQNPFTSQVSNTFPEFNLFSLLCNKEISHCNPSSAMEATHKHGGYKWEVDLVAPQGCAVGFEGGAVAVDAYAIQYHNFGMQSVEFETSRHSSVVLLRQCKADNPNDKGYIFVGQLQEYSERVIPYQGMVIFYPDSFTPAYDGRFGQYFTSECFGQDITFAGKFIDCRESNSYRTNLSKWTSKITGLRNEPRPPGSIWFTHLFDSRDNYERLDIRDLEYPFTWKFVCGMDVYNPVGCTNNNSTSTIHEIKGTVPAYLDNVPGIDTDPRVGRLSVMGYVTRYGDWNPSCTAPSGLDCQPIKTIGAFVGVYSSELSPNKVSNPTPLDTPERDIYFCNGVVCKETDFGATPSGWLGSSN